MDSLFASARQFNGDISQWNVSRVTDTSRMFYNTHSFHNDIYQWDVSNVETMSDMFAGSSSDGVLYTRSNAIRSGS